MDGFWLVLLCFGLFWDGTLVMETRSAACCEENDDVTVWTLINRSFPFKVGGDLGVYGDV